MKDFRHLSVWKRAHQLALQIYRLTASFPGEERYGLAGQMRRAAASIPSNIAEGCGRGSDADMKRFLQIAMGSACEREYQLLLAHDLCLLSTSDRDLAAAHLIEIKRMLSGFLKKLTPKN